MKKWFGTLSLTLLLLFAGNANAMAQGDIFLAVNGKKVETDAPCFIENSRTLVPVRFIGESLGYEVKWDNKTKQVTILNKSGDGQVSKIELIIDSDRALVYDKNDKKKEIKLEAPAKISKERTFVPIRFIGESFGTSIDWDKANRVVIVGDKSQYNPEVFAKLRQSEKPVKPVEKPNLKTLPAVEGVYLQNADAGLFFVVDKINKNDYGYTHLVRQFYVNFLQGEQREMFKGYFTQNPKTGELTAGDLYKIKMNDKGLLVEPKDGESFQTTKMVPGKKYKSKTGNWYTKNGELGFSYTIPR
ncbi:copper amine oxidase N-terminal domain-containing protein [Aedoeadaptatus coxii]|uniref:copper amine oxidase N-terminal domain-containing protein n=1 Tax=Aedoeadaptatus coxii TaxID=755172 RepID=UPI002AD2BD4E|nr:copper amine oxidase N-terminal domain-containing protein [Peptoniphilus coxii]